MPEKARKIPDSPPYYPARSALGFVAILLTTTVLFSVRIALAQEYTYMALPSLSRADSIYAYGINNAGTIVGSYTDSNDTAQSFLYRRGAFTTFAMPSGRKGINANGINGSETVVGSYPGSNDQNHGFFYYFFLVS